MTLPNVANAGSEAYKDFMRTVLPPETWEEWLTRARDPQSTLDEKLGLLHRAFEVRISRERKFEQVAFLFEVADGWTDGKILISEGCAGSWEEPRYFLGFDEHRNAIEERINIIRQILARKAFNVLVSNFFHLSKVPWWENADHGWKHDSEEKRMLRNFIFGPSFPTVRNFFRPEIETLGKRLCIRNLSYSDRSPQEKKVVDFLLKLPSFLWEWAPTMPDDYESEERKQKGRENALKLKAVIDEGKVWMVHVLSYLGMLNVLEPHILKLDAPCLTALEDIAMRSTLDEYKYSVTEDRPTATIAEACYAGSPEAWLLTKRELMVREEKRLNAIRDAEKVVEEATKKIAQLNQ